MRGIFFVRCLDILTESEPEEADRLSRTIQEIKRLATDSSIALISSSGEKELFTTEKLGSALEVGFSECAMLDPHNHTEEGRNSMVNLLSTRLNTNSIAIVVTSMANCLILPRRYARMIFKKDIGGVQEMVKSGQAVFLDCDQGTLHFY